MPLASTILIFQRKTAFQKDILNEFVFFKIGPILYLGHIEKEAEFQNWAFKGHQVKCRLYDSCNHNPHLGNEINSSH